MSRGANWVIKITLPHAYTGLGFESLAADGTGVITIPFATEESARLAASCLMITVVPGEDHVIAGEVITEREAIGDGHGQAG